jgi:uncharacterized MAPEG superfamily protein
MRLIGFPAPFRAAVTPVLAGTNSKSRVRIGEAFIYHRCLYIIADLQ